MASSSTALKDDSYPHQEPTLILAPFRAQNPLNPPPLAIFSVPLPSIAQAIPFRQPFDSTRHCIFSYYGPLTKEAFPIRDAVKFILGLAVPTFDSLPDYSGDHSPVISQHAESVLALLDAFLTFVKEDTRRNAAPQDRDAIVEAGWFVIRAPKKTDEWNIPRWHRDGSLVRCSECTMIDKNKQAVDITSDTTTPARRVPHSKYAFTLLGPATRFIRSNPETDSVMGTVRNTSAFQADLALRTRVDEDLHKVGEEVNVQEIVDVEGRKGNLVVARFSMGRVDSPVHSEPRMDGGDRMFVSLLPGRESEIKNLADGRGEPWGVVSDQDGSD